MPENQTKGRAAEVKVSDMADERVNQLGVLFIGVLIQERSTLPGIMPSAKFSMHSGEKASNLCYIIVHVFLLHMYCRCAR